MEIAKFKAAKRVPGGQHANHRLRQSGELPAVIYGHKEAPEHVSLPLREIEKCLAQAQHVLELDIDGAAKTFLLKDVQYDHLYRTPIHVDLMRVDRNERVHVKVPVHLIGTPKGLAGGGELLTLMTELDVEAPLLAIPDEIRVQIGDLEINGHVYVKELALPEGVTALAAPDDAVCLVRTKKAAVEVAAVEGAVAEPEVIAKGKIEDGDAAAPEKK